MSHEIASIDSQARFVEDLCEYLDSGKYKKVIKLAAESPCKDRKYAAKVRVCLAKALAMSGETAKAQEVLEQIVTKPARRTDGEVEAEALEWLSWLAWVHLDAAASRRIAEHMLNLAVPRTSAHAFHMHMGRAMLELQFGRARSAAAILDESERLSREADIGVFTHYLELKADVLCALGEPEEAEGFARLAAEIAVKRPDRFELWQRLILYSYVLDASGKPAAALAKMVEAHELARASRLTWEVPYSLARSAWLIFQTGRVSEACAMIRSCFDSPYRQPWMRATRAWIALTIGLASGDRDLVEQAADEEILEVALNGADLYTLGPVAAAFHEYYRQIGNHARADELLNSVISKLPSPDCAWMLLPAVGQYGNESTIAHAERLLDAFPLEHRFAAAYRRYFAAICARRRGERSKAERLGGEAQLFFEEGKYAYAAARCMEVAGRMHHVQQIYNRMGAAGDAARVRAMRVRRGRPSRGYEASRERLEILRLVLAGEMTADIAARFGVSPRTIKNRLTEIYAERGIKGRSELRTRSSSASSSDNHSE